MKISSRIFALVILLTCIISLGLFIYPGLYKYDKLNQKFPVKINRITGQTQVLYLDGWRNVDGYDSIALKMEEYRESIKNEILLSIREEIDLINEPYTPENDYINFDAIRNRSKENQDFEIITNNDALFEKGDSSEKVQEAMGTPDSIIGSDLFEIWSYGQSKVHFRNGSVSGWVNTDMNLKLK